MPTTLETLGFAPDHPVALALVQHVPGFLAPELRIQEVQAEGTISIIMGHAVGIRNLSLGPFRLERLHSWPACNSRMLEIATCTLILSGATYILAAAAAKFVGGGYVEYLRAYIEYLRAVREINLQ